MYRSVVCTVRTASAAETFRFGEALGRRIRRGTCVSLVGPLGAGKTVMVSGVCRGLEVPDPVTSPTFILLETFEGRLPVVHVDLYRLEHESELEEIGVFDYLATDRVLLVEWGDRSPSLHAAAEIEVRIDPVAGDARTIVVSMAAPGALDLSEIAW